jgi:Concanavalin A-like lectin/glucanases superfamily
MPEPRNDDEDDRIDDRRRLKKKGRKKKPKRRGSPMALIIGGAIAGVLLVGGVVVAVVMLTRGKSVPVPPPPDPFPDMVAHWSFDDLRVDNAKEQTTVRDSTGRGNDGILSGGRMAPGIRGNALFLDGSESTYLDVSKAKDLNFVDNADLTLAAWYQTKERVGTILAFRNSEKLTQLDLYVRDNHLLGIIGDDADQGPGHAFVWCDAVNDGQWHHAALVRKGKFIELYYDGMKAGFDARGQSGGKITGDMRYIGVNLKFSQEDLRKIPRIGFKGGIDEVYVFKRALSPQDIQALMKR